MQNAFAKHITKEEAQAQLETLKTPTETAPPKEESSSAAPWVIAGLIGVFGLLKLKG